MPAPAGPAVRAAIGTGPDLHIATARLRGPRTVARPVVIPGEPLADGYWNCPAQGCSWSSVNPMAHPCPVGGRSRSREQSPPRVRAEPEAVGLPHGGPAS
ncbi:hypothetical protein [Nocardiopsis dassonvillei]|uniref:hypothetical protein n=1 Tax=Nocardiopsis dassonvillei TaxID=2014 RepID=UPI003F55A374